MNDSERAFDEMPGMDRCTAALGDLLWLYTDFMQAGCPEDQKVAVEACVLTSIEELRDGLNDMLGPINRALGYDVGPEIDIDRPWSATPNVN